MKKHETKHIQINTKKHTSKQKSRNNNNRTKIRKTPTMDRRTKTIPRKTTTNGIHRRIRKVDENTIQNTKTNKPKNNRHTIKHEKQTPQIPEKSK